MILRIVKLHFKTEHVNEFLTYFESIKFIVNNFDGCKGMQLIQDIRHPEILFTYSYWESEEKLNSYRDSSTFGEVWPTIKPWFDEKPNAWTTQVVFDGIKQI